MRVKEVHVFRVPENEELMEYIGNFAEKNEVKCGSVSIIGALKEAEIGYYDEKAGEYRRKKIGEQCELLSAMGNISQHGEKPFLHIHVVLGKPDFSLTGGHLIRGRVFVAEVTIHEYDGRCPRNPHGKLLLWDTD